MLGNTSRPIIFELENTSALIDSDINMFMSSMNRGLPNSGFPANVTVSFNFPPYTYEQLLADSENQGFRIWRLRIDQTIPKIPKIRKYPPPALPPALTAQLFQPLLVTHATADGGINGYPMTPYQDLDQVLWSAIEYRYPIIIDASYGIGIKLLRKRKIMVSIWIDRNVSETNRLLTGDIEKVFVKPMSLEEKAPYIVELVPSFNTGRIVYGEDKSITFKPK